MLRGLLSRITRRFDSGSYWRQRYADGGNSGAGSYGRLAEYKAKFINDFVAERAIGSIVEFGFGDGAQAELFAFAHYVGVDVVPLLVERASKQFKDREGWRFVTADDYAQSPVKAELAMSLDVLYHLVEDGVFERYMQTLFSASDHYVLIYSSDSTEIPGSGHVRHRRYSDWIAGNRPDFVRSSHWPNPYPASPASDWSQTSFADFALYEKRRD